MDDKTGLQFSVIAAANAVGLLLAKITTDYNDAADFTRFHTYSWIGVKAGNELWTDRIWFWLGVAADVLSDTPEKNEKKLEKDVGDMFEHFPPKSRG